MRRLSLIVPVMLILALIAGCAGNSSVHSAKPLDSKNKSIAASNAEKSNTSKTAAANRESKTNNSATGAVVIVKSANKLSSKEKEAVLNDINNELDNLVQTINTMDDASDDDLNI